MWLSLTMSLDVTRCDIQSTCDNFPARGVAVQGDAIYGENTMRARVHSKKEKKFKNRV